MNRHQRKSSSSFKPGVTALEDRCLMAANFTFDAAQGLLAINGDNRRNNIAINDNGGGNLSINLDGAITQLSGVETVRIRSKGGNDTVNYNLNQPQNDDVFVDINTGLGDDKVNVTLWRDLLNAADVTFKVRLDAGNDDFQGTVGGDLIGGAFLAFDVGGGFGSDDLDLFADNTVNLDADATFNALINGDADRDFIDFRYLGVLDGLLKMQAKGGLGNDFISADLELVLGSDGEVDDSFVNGEAGTDDLTFLILKEDDDNVIIQASISGGIGFNDEATYTAGFVNPDNTIEDDNAV